MILNKNIEIIKKPIENGRIEKCRKILNLVSKKSDQMISIVNSSIMKAVIPLVASNN